MNPVCRECGAVVDDYDTLCESCHIDEVMAGE